MKSTIGNVLGTIGALIILAAVVVFFIVGFNFYLITPEFIDEGIIHPQRWWVAGATFFLMSVCGLILLGLAGIIDAIETGKLDPEEKKKYEEKDKTASAQ